jgi:hypothetical protein
MMAIEKRGGMLLSLIIFLLLVNIVSASFISITTQISDIQLVNGGGQTLFSIKNQGDETAFDVGLVLDLPSGFEGEDLFIGKLGPDESNEGSFNITSKEHVKEGVYPAVIVVNYRDGNSYPFSAITPFTIVNGKRTTSKVFGVLNEVKLAGDKSKKLTISIKNPDNEAHDLMVQIYLPNELNVDESFKTIQIGPLEERKMDYSVSSFSALPGSTYVIFASLTYEKDGAAYASFSRGTIKIVDEENLFSNQYLIAVLLILLMALLFYQFRGRK